jgi:hypothetical protein
MAEEQPLFDPSLKKRKKKVVAFTEDPLGPEADPTTPAPTIIENTTTNGDVVDLGPTTLHEQMKRGQNGASETGDAVDEVKEDNDFKAMFPEGIKKKKKKKDIPMDFVSIPPYSKSLRSHTARVIRAKMHQAHRLRLVHPPLPKILTSLTSRRKRSQQRRRPWKTLRKSSMKQKRKTMLMRVNLMMEHTLMR